MTNPVTEPKPASNIAADADPAIAADEDCSKEYAPVVALEQVDTKTGEEDEEVLSSFRSKLFRFSKELTEWKERGTGEIRILKHNETNKIRLLMRREKTLKICLNHYVNPSAVLKENVGSDRSWVWHAVDYADDEKDEALLAIRFRDSNDAKSFKEAYDSARDSMTKLHAQFAAASKSADPEASASANESATEKEKASEEVTKESNTSK